MTAIPPRESSFMPSIKCSNCGNDVEISLMGDHICSGNGDGAAPASPPAPAPAPAPAPSGGGFTMGNLLPSARTIQERLGGMVDTFMPIGNSVHDKIGEIPPVDTAMANRSYSRQPLTPLSLSSTSRSASPRTPGARPGTGRADEYFTQIDEDQNYAQLPNPGGYGNFGDVDAGSNYPGICPKKSHGPSLYDIAAGPYADDPDERPPMPIVTRESPFKSSRPSEDRGRVGPASISPPRLPKNKGYGGFGPPGSDDIRLAPNRAETFPVQPNEKREAPLRAPSAPGPRPDRLRDTSRPPPPRTSLVKVRTKNPSINLDVEFGASNPYHSPSASIASSQSRGSSRVSQPSTSTSPARSVPFDNSPISKSPPSPFSSLMNDVKTSMNDMRPKNLPPTPDLDEQSARQKRLPAAIGERYDPAVQGGRPPSPPPTKWDRNNRQDPAVQGGPSPLRSKDLPPSPREAARRRDPAVQKSRGNCKACGEAITGKSISSADGRLTGRYHKACFSCTSCYEPFTTAEFYVHGDRPYCKRHYHKMNGSLCGTCKEGIEGQYLEDESATKYHVQCFRCGDCQRVLHDGYFDVNGQAYCEKDAYRRMQATRRSPSVNSQTSQRSHGSSPLAPPGSRSGMRPPPGGPRGGMQGNGRSGPTMGLAPPTMPKMEKRMTRLGMMGGF